MRKYEIMYILNPNLNDADRSALIENLHKILTDHGASDLEVNEWGMRELAYPINHLNRGYYVVTTVNAEAAAINEFDRLSRINADVIRHLSVRLDEE